MTSASGSSTSTSRRTFSAQSTAVRVGSTHCSTLPVWGWQKQNTLAVPSLLYSLSTFLVSPGLIGSGSLDSPSSWNGFSSMHQTGRLGSYGRW